MSLLHNTHNANEKNRKSPRRVRAYTSVVRASNSGGGRTVRRATNNGERRSGIGTSLSRSVYVMFLSFCRRAIPRPAKGLLGNVIPGGSVVCARVRPNTTHGVVTIVSAWRVCGPGIRYWLF